MPNAKIISIKKKLIVQPKLERFFMRANVSYTTSYEKMNKNRKTKALHSHYYSRTENQSIDRAMLKPENNSKQKLQMISCRSISTPTGGVAIQVSPHTQGVRVHEHTLKPPMYQWSLSLASVPVLVPWSLVHSCPDNDHPMSRSVSLRPGRSVDMGTRGALVWGRGVGRRRGIPEPQPPRCPF